MTNIYYYLLAAIIICHTPGIRWLFSTVNTMVHESGHAIAALLTSGKVYSISLYASSEGLAETGLRSWFSRFFVSYAGYTFSSLVAFLVFFLLYIDKKDIIFYGLLCLAVLNLVLWVRNLYGVLWLLGYISISFYFHHMNVPIWKDGFTTLIACIILIQSVSTAFSILYLSLLRGSQAGDATSLAKQTYIPAIIWGLIFFGQSLISIYFVFSLFIF